LNDHRFLLRLGQGSKAKWTRNSVACKMDRFVRHAYPMMLDVTVRLVVIIGGGSVAVRKAKGLLQAGATRLRCVSPRFHADLPPEIERISQAFQPGHLDGADLIFATTDSPAVNEAVVAEARRRRILVCRADGNEEHPGDFSTPAIWRSDALAVTVSAAGSPALAAAIRDDLSRKIDPGHLDMATALQVLRPQVLASSLSAEQRRDIFRALATDEAVALLRRDGLAGLRQWLSDRYEGL
jgi:precorrin-2 dehydrogenase/sirohydrochlorin ferrochelatase